LYYPPDDEGVCTDLVWRAFKNAGYSLKDMVNKDIASNVSAYPRVNGSPDSMPRDNKSSYENTYNVDYKKIKPLFFCKYRYVI